MQRQPNRCIEVTAHHEKPITDLHKKEQTTAVPANRIEGLSDHKARNDAQKNDFPKHGQDVYKTKLSHFFHDNSKDAPWGKALDCHCMDLFMCCARLGARSCNRGTNSKLSSFVLYTLAVIWQRRDSKQLPIETQKQQKQVLRR
eukprot:5486786-Amphidinium_carterae.1